MICYMFPGQPMSRQEMPREEPAFLDLARRCRDRTGFDPLQPGDSPPDMPESVRLQLFGVTMSLHRFDMLLRQTGLPDVIAEHSMGIYAALAAAESISYDDAMELTWRIGTSLAEMGRRDDYALGSVIGLAAGPLLSVAEHNGVHMANRNTSRHFLLAGGHRRIEVATVEAEAAGAFSVGVFPSDAPLHTPLVGEIAADLRRIVADYRFREPRIPLVDHLRQGELTAADIPGFLVEELCCPVFWDLTYRALRDRGVSRFLEAGAGQPLSKFNRWIDSES